jgi:hypothetical protein
MTPPPLTPADIAAIETLPTYPSAEWETLVAAPIRAIVPSIDRATAWQYYAMRYRIGHFWVACIRRPVNAIEHNNQHGKDQNATYQAIMAALADMRVLLHALSHAMATLHAEIEHQLGYFERIAINFELTAYSEQVVRIDAYLLGLMGEWAEQLYALHPLPPISDAPAIADEIAVQEIDRIIIHHFNFTFRGSTASLISICELIFDLLHESSLSELNEYILMVCAYILNAEKDIMHNLTVSDTLHPHLLTASLQLQRYLAELKPVIRQIEVAFAQFSADPDGDSSTLQVLLRHVQSEAEKTLVKVTALQDWFVSRFDG